MTAIKDEFEWVDVIVNSAGVLDEANPKRTIDINYVCISIFNLFHYLCEAFMDVMRFTIFFMNLQGRRSELNYNRY